jgi:GAF domain-containing protein
MPQDPENPVVDAVTDLATLLFTELSFEDSMRHVSALAVATIPSCDAAGVSLAENGGVTSHAVTDDFTLQVDSYQYESGEGPCVETVRTGRPNRIDRMADERRWPQFCGRAADAGVLSVMSVPLRAGDANVGALNLYARTHPFDDHDEEIGLQFGVQAAVVLANARAYAKSQDVIDQLQRALESRDVIGQAKGIVMTREQCNPERAFEILRSLSQRRNQKLRDVAAELVGSARDGDSNGRTGGQKAGQLETW